MQVTTLKQGIFSVDATKEFKPFDPGVHSYAERPASLFISVQPFLINMGGKLILLDTGLGLRNADGKLRLYDQLDALGYQPDDVDLILMTHLHFDHAGGLVTVVDGREQLAFTNAEIVVQTGEWEFAYTRNSASYRKPIFEFLRRNAGLVFVEGSGTLMPGIDYELSGGHTPNHQVFWLTEGDDKVFMGGDVLAEPEELKRKFAAKYDYDGKAALEKRWEYGKRAAAEGWRCLFYHGKSYSQGYVNYADDHFTVTPAAEGV